MNKKISVTNKKLFYGILIICVLVVISLLFYFSNSWIKSDSSIKTKIDNQEIKYIGQEFTKKDTYTKRFGIRGLKHSENLEKTLKLVTDTGMTWTRLELSWDEIESEKGKYEWQEFDKTLADILEKRLKVMITIKAYSEWACKNCGLHVPKDKPWLKHDSSALPDNENINSYREFIKELIERYDGDDNFGLVSKPPETKIREIIIKNPVKHWQIENEPGEEDAEKGSGFWNGTAKELAELFIIANKEIKEADVKAKVLPAGFTLSSVLVCNKTRDCFLKVFLLELRNRKSDFDIFDIHNYGDVETIDKQVSILKNILEEYEFENKKIWMSELDINWRRLNPGISKAEYDNIRSVELVKKYIETFSNGVEIIIQWTTHDTPGMWPPTTVPEFIKFRGIVENDLTPKPIYYVLKRMISKLDGFKKCTDVSLSYPSQQVFQFLKESGNKKSGNLVYVAWSTNGKEGTSTLNLTKDEVKVTDIFGKETIIKGDSIILTDIPVYVEKIVD